MENKIKIINKDRQILLVELYSEFDFGDEIIVKAEMEKLFMLYGSVICLTNIEKRKYEFYI